MNFPPARRHETLPDIETAVIGAGVVGLAIARALASAGHEVMVLERHDGIGRETSGRSSEVIHAGLYYPSGSLRAKLCTAGRDLLYAFAVENGVPHVRYGKLVVATGKGELARLDALSRTAEANGVADVVRLGEADVRSLEPEVSAVAALFSPSTGVIDSHALMVALEGHLRAGGGDVVLNTEVRHLSARSDGLFEIEALSAGQPMTLTARNLVIAAGLGATKLGRMLAAGSRYQPPETYPARGHYYVLEGRVPFCHLVYPLPEAAWLGLHLTLDVAGRAKFGPDLEWCGRSGAAEDTSFDGQGGERLACFEREIRRYWPGLPDGALAPGYVGIRPKIYRNGEPAADFAIHGEREHGIARLVALYGIESPGLTSSLAIGEHVAALFRG